MLNKSLWTNVISLLLILAGLLADNQWLYDVGLFAFSGAITNWLAIYMLFEKVPGIYGSGVVPNRFEAFKTGLYDLVMTQFFTQANIARLLDIDKLAPEKSTEVINNILAEVDFNPLFDTLLDVVSRSSFAAMLQLVGGKQVLEPMREPFLLQVRETIMQLLAEGLITKIKSQFTPSHDVLLEQIAVVVKRRIDELTPQVVKEIVQKMIQEHLGWLVVWGGVFGGFIGVFAAIRI